MRQIILDTETTGLDPELGHRIIEIGCLELVNRRLTGNYFHQYLNPERAIENDSLKIHGISQEFLADKPTFGHIASDFLNFVSESELIIHNADFDISFLKLELQRCSSPKDITKLCKVFDTLSLARKLHPGQRNSLDALCKRYQVNNSHRKFHGALLDAELLAYVYLAMTGGQMGLFTEETQSSQTVATQNINTAVNAKNDWVIQIRFASQEEESAHLAFLEKIKQNNKKASLWEQLQRIN